MQDRVRTSGHPFNVQVSTGGMKQGRQFRCSSAEILVGLPSWLSHRLSALSQLWDRLIWSTFILDVHGDSTLLTVQVGLLDQLFFASVSGSVTTTTPSFRRRLAVPVSHHVRSRCQVMPAPWSVERIVKILIRSSPCSRRNTVWSVVNDQVAVPHPVYGPGIVVPSARSGAAQRHRR